MLLHRCYRDHLKRKLTQNWKHCHHLHVSLQTAFFFCPYITSQCSPVLFLSPMTFIVWTEKVKTIFCCVLQKIIQNDDLWLNYSFKILPTFASKYGSNTVVCIIWPALAVLTFKTRLPRNNTPKYNKQIIILHAQQTDSKTSENIST